MKIEIRVGRGLFKKGKELTGVVEVEADPLDAVESVRELIGALPDEPLVGAMGALRPLDTLGESGVLDGQTLVLERSAFANRIARAYSKLPAQSSSAACSVESRWLENISRIVSDGASRKLCNVRTKLLGWHYTSVGGQRRHMNNEVCRILRSATLVPSWQQHSATKALGYNGESLVKFFRRTLVNDGAVDMRMGKRSVQGVDNNVVWRYDLWPARPKKKIKR